jgi:hypothetical protein
MFGAERIPVHMGVSRLPASRWRSETLPFGVSRPQGGGISTIQDQFALLKQIGYFPKGPMRRSPCLLATGGGTRQVVRILRRRVQVQC